MFEAPPSLPTPSPADSKAAAAKAKADPKAAALAAAEAAAALAAIPLKPCSLLSPALAAQLNPVVITPCKVQNQHYTSDFMYLRYSIDCIQLQPGHNNISQLSMTKHTLVNASCNTSCEGE